DRKRDERRDSHARSLPKADQPAETPAKKHKPVLFSVREGTGSMTAARRPRGLASAPAFQPRVLPSKDSMREMNGPVSWLEAGWLSLPSEEAPVGVARVNLFRRRRRMGCDHRHRASDSGGAAPDSHRLPKLRGPL